MYTWGVSLHGGYILLVLLVVLCTCITSIRCVMVLNRVNKTPKETIYGTV
jgi:hypothetical protein